MNRPQDRQRGVALVTLVLLGGCNSVRNRQAVFPNPSVPSSTTDSQGKISDRELDQGLKHAPEKRARA